VGGKNCPLSGPISASTIKCALPGGTGRADVVVTSGAQTATFVDGYRYITGRE
jgi:hypothetical protein